MSPSQLKVQNLTNLVPYPMFISKTVKKTIANVEKDSEQIIGINVRLLETLGLFDHNVTRFYEDGNFTRGTGQGQTKREQKESVVKFLKKNGIELATEDANFHREIEKSIEGIRMDFVGKSPSKLYSDSEKRWDIVSKLNTSHSKVQRERCEFKFYREPTQSIQVQLVSRKVVLENERYLFEIVVDSRLLDEFKTKVAAYRGILDSEFESLMVHELDTTTFKITWQNKKSIAVLGEKSKEHVASLTAASEPDTEERVRRKSSGLRALGSYRDLNKRWYLTENFELIPVLIEEYGFEPHLKISGNEKSAPRKAVRRFTGVVTSNFDARIPNDLMNVIKGINYQDALLSKVNDLHCAVKVQGKTLINSTIESVRQGPLRKNFDQIKKEKGDRINPEKFYFLWVNSSFEKALRDLNQDDTLSPIGLTDDEVFDNAFTMINAWQDDDKNLIASDEDFINGIEAHPEPNSESKLVYFLKRKLKITTDSEMPAIQVIFWEFEKTSTIRKELKQYLVASHAYQFCKESEGGYLKVLNFDAHESENGKPIAEDEKNPLKIPLSSFAFNVFQELSELEGKPIKIRDLSKRLGLEKKKAQFELPKLIPKSEYRRRFYRFFFYTLNKSQPRQTKVDDMDVYVVFLPKLDEYGRWPSGD